MDKNNLKFYVSPEVEIVDVELEGVLLDASIEKPVLAPELEDEE